MAKHDAVVDKLKAEVSELRAKIPLAGNNYKVKTLVLMDYLAKLEELLEQVWQRSKF